MHTRAGRLATAVRESHLVSTMHKRGISCAALSLHLGGSVRLRDSRLRPPRTPDANRKSRQGIHRPGERRFGCQSSSDELEERNMETPIRVERDTMGEVRVPAEALYGAETQRAVENFPISRLRFTRPFIRALGIVKAAAAKANGELGALPGDLAAAIETAAQQVAQGDYDAQFVVDIFQTGSGTSTNMNANEVIARLAR